MVLSISGDAQSDPYHPLVDCASWSFINERKIYHDFLSPIKPQIAQLSNEEWGKLLHIVKEFSQQMIHSIEGNHFLLMGQERVRKIVQIIENAEKDVSDFSAVLRNFFPLHKFPNNL